MNSCKFPNIESLMDNGEPVCITLSEEDSDTSDLLYCELVHNARHGEASLISHQRCRPGDYVLGISENSPADYYLKSGRYKNAKTAEKAASNLPRIKREFKSLRIEPLKGNKGKFDVLLLYLKPESAMRIIQAYAYHFGEGIESRSIGAASICGDCTAKPLQEGIGISYGCKGSRKHSNYANEEVPLGIRWEFVKTIEEGLKNIPATFE
ncbi:DUF169 domain-containing protein [Methanolobus sp. ZRKC5]|uniref:DUF169 domain-containing protein n=1 Tax=unclassified Methanolobus TaxID=2629569 RepID=UPI00313DD71D